MRRLKRIIQSALVFLCSSPSYTVADDQRPWLDESLSYQARAGALVAAMTLDEKIAQLNDATPAIDRLGVAEYHWWNEALHGVARNGRATIFPQIIGIGASFDPELSHKMARAIAMEARAKYNLSQAAGNRGQYTGLTFWSPNVNLFRDPRWGRGQETFGEATLLTQRMSKAFVQGLQGDHPDQLRVAAAAKHFVVHSGPEALRHSFDARPSVKDMQESYLPAFETLVRDAKVAGVMCAYNAVDGVPACASEPLLKTLLRDHWGFDGYVVSDCGALYDIHHGHRYRDTPEQAAATALMAGVNLNCGFTYPSLKAAVKQGLVDSAQIDQRLIELLTIRFRLGMFDSPEHSVYHALGEESINNAEHIALARELATRSIVLLKNHNNVLPLNKNIKVPYVTGPFAASSDVLMANYYGISGNMVTLLEGIANKVSATSSLNYRAGVLPFHENLNPLNWAPMVAKTADATIAVMGLSADREGEEVDAIASEHKGDRASLQLPTSQVEYIKTLAANKKGPLILVIASGSPVALGELHDLADAIVQVWYPGEQGGNAVADILFGDANPSGHLPITFPASVEQLPAFDDYRMAGRTYKFMTAKPLYPFGFGLSYTQFAYSDLRVNQRADGSLDIQVTVTNTGPRDGNDLVQIYLQPMAPAEQEARFDLKDFHRVPLTAGEYARLHIKLPASELVRVNMAGDRVALKGQYRLIVSNALPIARSQTLGASPPVSATVHFR